MTFKMRLWYHGIISGLITGTANTILAILGAASGNAIGFTMPSFTLKQVCVLTLVGGIVGAAAYIVKSPLPAPEPEPKTESDAHELKT